MNTYLFEPLDTWFFREARPFDVAGGNELASVFPPSARTVASALHTVLNEAEGGCWTGPAAAARTPLDQMGCRGPWLVRRDEKDQQRWERLYPLPLDLFRKPALPGQEDADPDYLRLSIPKQAVRCDLGEKILLPVLDERGAKPVEDAWLTAAQLKAILDGGTPAGTPVKADELFKEESRIGLARDNRRRAYADGLLFSTRHVRLREGVALALDWDGAVKPDWPGACVRFGGEGRMARISPTQALLGLAKPTAQGGERGLILMLLTQAKFRPRSLPTSEEAKRHEPTTIPPRLEPGEHDGHSVWQGPLQYRRDGKPDELELTVHCAVVGKAVREGGWRADRNRPRPVRNYLPAGSLWYCTLENQTAASLNAAIEKLHGAQIGEDAHFGRGELAVGLWKT